MKVKKYSLLYFHHLIDKYSKWIFPLHEGENIIGSDKNVDIFLYLDENVDKIESIHCKIIVDEYQNNLSIISLSDSNNVQKEENDNKIVLSPGKKYELTNKSIFYLGENLKFIVINDTIDEIYNYFIEQRLENEFQKWKQLISYLESNVNIKISLNLTRKESLNKSNVSIKSNNNNNLINSNINNNNTNSLLNSNNKDINRIGFNNFDEVPDDNWFNDNENSNQKNNLDFSPFKQENNLSNQNNQNSNINTVKFSFDETPKNSLDMKINEDNKIINDIFHSKDPRIKNNYEENLINSSNMINNKISQENHDENNNNNLPLNKDTKMNDFTPLKNKFHEEKTINKDEKTIKMIKELLGENNLEIIINNTNLKKIKKFDVLYKKANKAKIDMGNFDIKFSNKSNIFGNI
jgi:hypothetical protein